MELSLSVFMIFTLLVSSQLSSSALAANPGVLVVNELASSPSHMIAMKNTAVWLHWNYTYGGDISVITYKEQIIGCKSSSQSFEPLAKRTGFDGDLRVVSSLPAHFSGRIDVNSSNSTLMIKNLQLNDSTFSFSSYVARTIQGSASPSITDLKPAVRITVQGFPEFTVSKPSSIEVEEGTSLKITVEMNGNPQPSVDFSWPHLGQAPTNMLSKKIFPFVFTSTYNSPPIGAGYCGRNLITLAKNSAGTAPPQLTNITVLLKLDIDPKLEAGKIADQRCVEVKWKKAESGLCFVKYEVKFKNASGSIIYTEIGYNINSKKKCSIPEKINITNVELSMSFKTSTKTTAVKVSENPIPTTAAPTTPKTTSSTTGQTSSQSRTTASSSWTDIRSLQPKTQEFKCQQKACNFKTGAMVGSFFGGVFFGSSLALLGYCILIQKREKKKKGKASNIHNTASDKSTNEMHYMDLRKREEQPVYEGLTPKRSQLLQDTIVQKTQDHRMPSKQSIQRATNSGNEFHYMDLKECTEQPVYAALGTNQSINKRLKKDPVYENSPAGR